MPLFPMTADHLASQAGLFEPQRRNHFQVEFYLENPVDSEIIRLSIESGFLPHEGNEPIEIPWMNSSSFVAGKRTLEQGQLRVRDFVDRGAAAAVYRWRKSVYNPVTGQVGYASDYKKMGSIILCGPDGVRHTRIWSLHGCWPTAVDPGELNYQSNEILVMGVVIRFDKAIPIAI